MNRVWKIVDVLLSVAGLVMCAFFFVCWLSVNFEVVARYFFNSPQMWVLELVEIALVCMSYLALGWVLRSGEHIKMDFQERWSPRRRILANIFTSALTTAMSIIVVWYGIENTIGLYHRGTVVGELRILQAHLVIIIPIGFFLLLIQSLRMNYEYVKQFRALTSKDVAPPVARM